MPETLLHVPRLGEGVHEARILGLLKSPGERVGRDEPLIEVETDKAVYVMEAPEDGVVDRWEVEPGVVLPVGALIGAIRDHNGGKPTPARNGALPPRTRAWCRDRGLSEDEIEQIRRGAPAGTLQVADCERWFAEKTETRYRDVSPSPQRRALNSALERGWRSSVPAWIETEVDWDLLTGERRKRRRDGARAGSVEILAWRTLEAMRKHSTFRAEIHGDRLREHVRALVGVAVALPGDELGTAVVEEQSDFVEFCGVLRERIRETKEGVASARRAQVVISYMAPFGITGALPLLAPPSIATLFVGAPRGVPVNRNGAVAWRKMARFTLAFDHRAANGTGAAKFLRDITNPS
jgi:pyruvate/2-oxoglutarate dehydrogenase complex dihydrolipoamide acyltransferase (E2) component